MCDELKKAVVEFFKILDIVETSDSGNEFRPNYIGSCRVMDTMRMGELITTMKELTKENQTE